MKKRSTTPKGRVRQKLTPLPKLLKKAETVVNAYVRVRDADQPCISCGGWHTLQAGHYIAVSKCSFLRFDERNINGQCGGCNGPLRGNEIKYRMGLRKKIGDLELEALERAFIENRCHKWSRSDLETIINFYSDKLKTLKAA